MRKWREQLGMFGSNYILDINDDAFISYNPNPCAGFYFFEADDGSSETALLLIEKEKYKYYILNGDYLDEYSRAIEADGLHGSY